MNPNSLKVISKHVSLKLFWSIQGIILTKLMASNTIHFIDFSTNCSEFTSTQYGSEVETFLNIQMNMNKLFQLRD